MEGFSGIILFIVSFYATVNFYRIYSLTRQILHFCLGTSAVFLAIIGISDLLATFFPVLDPDFINEWATVFSVSFLLSASAALVRDSKPFFSRFPRVLTFSPLILILIYPLILETVMVKMWVVALYQASSLFIGMLIYSYNAIQNSSYGYMLVGIIFFIVTFILFWLPASVFTMPSYAWVLLVSCGILIITVGYNHVFNLEEEILDKKDRKETWFM